MRGSDMRVWTANLVNRGMGPLQRPDVQPLGGIGNARPELHAGATLRHGAPRPYSRELSQSGQRVCNPGIDSPELDVIPLVWIGQARRQCGDVIEQPPNLSAGKVARDGEAHARPELVLVPPF